MQSQAVTGIGHHAPAISLTRRPFCLYNKHARRSHLHQRQHAYSDFSDLSGALGVWHSVHMAVVELMTKQCKQCGMLRSSSLVLTPPELSTCYCCRGRQ